MSICYIAWCYQIHFPYFCVLIHLPTYLLSPGFPRPHQTGYMRSCLQYKLYFCNSYPICDLRFLEFFRASHFLSCKLLEEIESMYVNKVAGLPVTPQAACWSSSTKVPLPSPTPWAHQSPQGYPCTLQSELNNHVQVSMAAAELQSREQPSDF